MKFNDYILIRLHREYDISSTIVLKLKYNQQYVDFFKILEKIEHLIYRLNLLTHWRIHLVLSIAQLEFSSSFDVDFFRRKRSNHFDSIFVEKNIDKVKSFEIERFINKRQIKRRKFEYLIRWREYESKFNNWRNLSKLDNVANLIRNYENVMKTIIILLNKRMFVNISSN